MAWLWLGLAGVAEIVWAIGLKYTDGFSRPLQSAIVLAVAGLSVVLLGFASKTMPLGQAYAIWTAFGSVGTVLAGIVLFDEPRDLMRLFCVLLIIAGVAGLKWLDHAER